MVTHEKELLISQELGVRETGLEFEGDDKRKKKNT